MDLWDFYIFSRSHRDDLVGQTIQNHKKTPTFTQWIGLLGKIYTGNHRFPHQITWGLNRFQFSKTNPLTYHMFFGKNGHPPAVIWGYQNLGPWIWEKSSAMTGCHVAIGWSIGSRAEKILKTSVPRCDSMMLIFIWHFHFITFSEEKLEAFSPPIMAQCLRRHDRRLSWLLHAQRGASHDLSDGTLPSGKHRKTYGKSPSWSSVNQQTKWAIWPIANS